MAQYETPEQTRSSKTYAKQNPGEDSDKPQCGPKTKHNSLGKERDNANGYSRHKNRSVVHNEPVCLCISKHKHPQHRQNGSDAKGNRE